MRAPNSMSFLSKAYNFLKGKPLANDENFYATKSKSAFPNEIYPILSEPIVHNGFPSLSRKNGQVLGEVTNRSWSVTSDRERNPQRTGLECFSPRALVKNYWTAKGEKKFNSDAQTTSNNKIINEQGEDDDEEGIFTIQLIKPHNGFLGIVLAGGTDTPLQKYFVNDILPNSSASKSGRVRNGDELLQANGKTLAGKTHAEALTIFRSLPAEVELVVARTKDANRSILERLNHKKKVDKKVNHDIATPVRRRSIIEDAAKTSVIPSSLASIVDVPKKAFPHGKPVKRISRVSSFVGIMENKISTDSEMSGNGEEQQGNQEDSSEIGDSSTREIKEACNPASTIETEDYTVYQSGVIPAKNKTPDSLSMKSVPLNEATFDLPQILEDEAVTDSIIRRACSRTINGYLKRQSIMEQSDSRATWPAFTTKQRLSLPWDSCALPRPVTIGRSSSARIRRNIATISASNPSLCQSSSVRKLSGKHYIERKTLTIEIQRESTTTDWGFTIGGGICSPYGDLPIFIADVSALGVAQGLLQQGDEIVDFSEESFKGSTSLEAEKKLRGCTKKKVTVTIRRKFLQLSPNPQRNPYAEAWRSLNTTNSSSGWKQRKRAKSMHC